MALSILLIPVAEAMARSTAQNCTQINELGITGVSSIYAQFVEAGRFKFTDGQVAPKLRAFCRVRGRASPTKDSDIRFEVWLPVDDWNGRLWGNGNGWFAGSISEAGLAQRVAAGYAALATDTGHHAADKDTSWALGHPEKVVDFGYRAIHAVSLDAKRIVARFYGRPPGHSYFSSCSNGGRQALMEAQRYPSDYDGIMAGAPAADWTHLFVGTAIVNLQWLATGRDYLPANKLPALHAAVLSACDNSDGVSDGILDDPRRCDFDPSVLECKSMESEACLTVEQIDTVRKLYSGPALHSGRQLIPGYSLGGELAWTDALLGDGPGTTDTYRAVTGFFRNMVFRDAHWDPRSFDPEQAATLADRRLAYLLNATDPDLSQFIGRGGKLIFYQGWSDPLVPPVSTIEYFDRVVSAVGRGKASASVRLFLAPGMGRCGGGPAPNDFGQFDAGDGNPESSLGAALQRWVEHAIAPERVVATQRTEEDDPSGVRVVRTRPLCAYPSVARYRGAGNVDKASSFTCAEGL